MIDVIAKDFDRLPRRDDLVRYIQPEQSQVHMFAVIILYISTLPCTIV